ncbi:hypothetical protein [Micromonospora sp. WMMA2032]|uniref:hypothetical protein n=1 Tax=Micromonospora sp. WMMA2032 TaxID=2039870 RepID=UPI0020A5CF09|nr:hypothetical protein [Micromonospora sp. WMMA2032]
MTAAGTTQDVDVGTPLGSAHLAMVSDMHLRCTRSGSIRVGGNVALGVGLLIALFMVSPENPQTGGYVLAGLLVLTGVGLRVEAALIALHEQRGYR